MKKQLNVLDTSALLAWVMNEPGGDLVEHNLQEACAVSAVNLAEFATKLIDLGYTDPASITATFHSTGALVVPFDEQQAMNAALLRPISRKRGLSLGDRACLALAQQLDAEVLTSDQAWLKLGLDLPITDIRAP